VFGLKRFFQQSHPISHLWKQGLMCCSFDSFQFGLRVFFNSSTQFHLWKQGLKDVLLFWFLSSLVLRVFFNPIPTYESRIEWCAAPLWFLSLCLS
jgi:hypothetical protein